MSLERVREALKGTELEDRIIELDQSSATVELAAYALRVEPDRIAKSLSFLVGSEPVVIVVSGESRINNKKFRAYFHKKAKMIPYEQVEELTGYGPGGVCPFGLNPGVKVYLDRSLTRYLTVYPAAGSANSAVEVTMEELERYSGCTEWVDVVDE